MSRDIQIFKEEPGFIKLFQLFKEKYRSLGKMSGTVKLDAFNKGELTSIAGFLGQSPNQLVSKGRIALSEFEKELDHTGFGDWSLQRLLEEVLEETLFTKKEEEQQEAKEEADFLTTIKQTIPEAGWWIEWIQSKSPDTRFIWALYKESPSALSQKIIRVFSAFSDLPKEGAFERLPFFAQRLTGNPHYFDLNEEAGKLLIHCMSVHRYMNEKRNERFVFPKGTEALNECLGEYGIMRDDLWNFVTCQGLSARMGHDPHPVWEAALRSHSVLNIPLKELVKVDRIWPANGQSVWILENSSVASTIMEAVPDAPIICTHGQFRLASWRVLDLLSESNCTFYYSGDLDPEGIMIADRFKRRYKDKAVIWRMDRKSYEFSLSDEDISNRLNKLDSIDLFFWKGLINRMKLVKKAGYQEALVPKLIADIREQFESKS